jgi:1,4-dihydroxy-6-naphthoate synthase
VRELTFGFSPCPNDTFAFHALVHGLVEAPFPIRPVLLDIEELNRRARDGAFDLTKVSFSAFPAAAAHYRLLRSGAALGTAMGPLVVAREEVSLAEAGAGPIAIPGYDTTAFLLLRLATPELGSVIELPYDRIPDAVAGGAVEAGLVIHEARFTYADHGLVRIADLGSWWEAETGLPVPLAGICGLTNLDGDVLDSIEHGIAESVEYAFAHPDASREYVQEHAQELSDEVCDAHIRLYVNELSVDLGERGRAAVDELLRRGEALGPFERPPRLEFVV